MVSKAAPYLNRDKIYGTSLVRKKRYFILRKDREDLVLLGSIPLDIDTRISIVQGEDTGNMCMKRSHHHVTYIFYVCSDAFPHVLTIETDQSGAAPSKMYIRLVHYWSMLLLAWSNLSCIVDLRPLKR
jgi:hypothetical protein